MPALLARHMGHIFCGMYARVVKTGRVQLGDAIEKLGAAQTHGKHYAHPDTAPAPAEWPRFAKVVKRITEDQHVDSFWLQDPLANQRAPVQAGQHVRIHMQDGSKSFWRAYTVSAVQGDKLRISVKRATPSQGGSAWLHANANEGSRVVMSGAFGEFTVSKDIQHPLAFISAGIGITPIVAMLQDLVRQESPVQITVLHACNSTDDLALWKEVQALVAQLPEASCQLFLNQASEVECTEFKAVKGQMHFESLARGDLKQTSVYMCGPGGFMQFAQDKLVAIGLSENHIHREVFASPNAASGRASPAPAEGP